MKNTLNRQENRRIRLKQLIDVSFNGKQVLFAEKTDIAAGLVSRYLSGVKSIGESMRDKIESACKLPSGWLDSASHSNIVAAPTDTRRIPLISYVQAGNWSEIVDSYEPGDGSEWLLTDLDLSNNAFGLEIKGESMEPDFKHGDRVIIDPNIQPQPGDFVVAKNGHNEATFKKYRPRSIDNKGREIFELVPLNPDFPSMMSDIVTIVIVGTMVEHRRYRKR